MFMKIDAHTLVQTFKDWARHAEANGHGNAKGVLDRMARDAETLTMLPHDALMSPQQSAQPGVQPHMARALPPFNKPEDQWTPEEVKAVQVYKQAQRASQGPAPGGNAPLPGAGQVVPPQVKAYEQVPSGVLGVPKTAEEAYGAASTTYQPSPEIKAGMPDADRTRAQADDFKRTQKPLGNKS